MEPGIIKLGQHRGRYVAQWYEPVNLGDGIEWRRRREGTGLKFCPENKAAAEMALALIKEKVFSPEGHTVAKIWSLYLASKGNERGLNSAKHFLPFFGQLDVGKINVHVCQAYIDKRREQGAADGTINRELTDLRAACRKFAPEGHRDFVFQMPPKSPPKVRYLTKDEFLILREAVAPVPHLALFVELAIATGGRKSAICELTWDRVDFDRRLIDLGKAASKIKGRATVPMTDKIYDELLKAKGIALSNYVIEFHGDKVVRIDQAFRRRVRATPGLEDVTPHVLRHSAAVWMAEARVPMVEIAQYLGHTSTRITESHYARFSPDFLRGAASALNI